MSGRFINQLLREYLPDLPARQVYMMADFLFLLKKWNRVYNLTSITTAKAMVIRHIMDSISISPFLKDGEILDVGTGAGLPGIPLAILNPRKHFVLLDSNNKKTKFLNQVKIDLRLRNVDIVNLRIEEFSEVKRFDSITSRAFASLNDFCRSSKIFLKDSGEFLAMKGVYPLIELEVLDKEFKVVSVEKLVVPGLTAERNLVRATVLK